MIYIFTYTHDMVGSGEKQGMKGVFTFFYLLHFTYFALLKHSAFWPLFCMSSEYICVKKVAYVLYCY